MTELSSSVRTRFAPSPTGFMHVGNLRTALYEYLVAKSMGGTFVLRIEDTDQERYVEGAVDIIYHTLHTAGLIHDEGPDIGGNYGPYVQSERMELYRPYAEQLVASGHAYYCFCTKERLASLHDEKSGLGGYDRHCRDLSQEEIDANLKAGIPYVIRQKMPTEGETTFHDAVYGDITVSNKELEDQILLKADGYPTYNFANVIDDHLMHITHVVRGSEYLSSTPKYNLLYEAFGFEIPTYIHLPLIQGKNPDGTVSKLSKRHGATGFEDLIADGYLPQAIINYIALLGWCPKDTQEVFSLKELEKEFSIAGISKSPAVFDYDKLAWFNSEYIKQMTDDEFIAFAKPEMDKLPAIDPSNYAMFTEIMKPRISKRSDISEKLAFLKELADYDLALFEHKKSKTTKEGCLQMLETVIPLLESASWDKDSLSALLTGLSEGLGVKNALVMWPVRIAASGTAVTPGGAVEVLLLLGKEESMRRIHIGLDRLNNELK